MVRSLRSFFRSLTSSLTSRHSFEAAMSDELRFHLEQYTADLVRSGVTPEEAARRARIEFGALSSVKEECREAKGMHFIEALYRQWRYAIRMMRKSPGFAATAILTLAICLGANLMIFAVIDSILLRPLPLPEAERLVTIFNTYPKAGVDRDGSSLTNYYERRGRIKAFASLALYRPGTAIVGGPGATEREAITRITPDFFSAIGVRPAIGRAFTEEETTFRTDSVAIITDSYWKQRFNADPNVVGRRVRVDGLSKLVVGVLPPEFRFLSSQAGIYLPLSSRLQDRSQDRRHSGGNSTHMIARLTPEATVAVAQSQIDAHNASVEGESENAKRMADAGFRSLVVSLHTDHVATIRPALLLLQAGVFVLLLIGVVNLINLLLIRANGRGKELAVRQSLGATQSQLVSEVVIETTVLALVAGVLGFVGAAGATELLGILGADRLPLGSNIAFDARVGLVAMAGAVVIGIVLAAPIAWFNIHRPMGLALQSETRSGTASHGVQRLRYAFLVTQIAMAFVLLAGTGLLALSLKQAMAISPGFRSENILTGQVSMPWGSYANVFQRLAFVENVMREIAKQPGVASAGLITNVPLSGNAGKSAATIEGHVLKPGEPPHGIYSYGVGGDYFDTMGFSLRSGRFLTDADSRRAERVCVVDEDIAKRYWPNADPIGRRLWQGFQRPGEASEADLFTVVGVVGRVKQAGLTEDSDQGAIYYPYAHRSDSEAYLVVRTAQAPESLALTMQKVVRQVDRDLPVTDIRSMEARIASSLSTRRSPALLSGIFSLVAILLTAIGTYGVLSYAVAQRRREIGVRMALGAQPQQIRIQFLRLALSLIIPGAILGLIGAIMTGQAMQSILFQLPALNWDVLGGAGSVIALVTLIACLLPSHRAARISPLEALADQ
ncbi:MAG TPA: ABC transporter permease [Bryobacteraceae bacterium]|nr:ABC transporter permease [Bryobacteraceae bacterium]